MRTFSSQDLQQQSGEIQRAAVSGPVVIMSPGKPRSIVMSVGEFRRLKQRAGETVPSELERPRPVVRREPMRDPLGYATSDLKSLALTMADAALSGRNREAVHAEIAAVEQRAGSQMSVAELTVEHERRSRILIPDTSPIFLLAMIGSDALDWLYVTNADVWIPDMVKTEATRPPPDPGDDQRLEHRATITDWFKRNENRIHIVETHEGIEYAKAMQAWTLAGSKPELKPSWRGRGEKSVLQVLDVVESVLADGEAAVVLVDDNKARIAIQLENEFDIDLLGTESFVTWMHEKFNVANAENAWAAIKIAAGGNAPVAAENDPIYMRK